MNDLSIGCHQMKLLSREFLEIGGLDVTDQNPEPLRVRRILFQEWSERALKLERAEVISWYQGFGCGAVCTMMIWTLIELVWK